LHTIHDRLCDGSQIQVKGGLQVATQANLELGTIIQSGEKILFSLAKGIPNLNLALTFVQNIALVSIGEDSVLSF